MLQPACFCVRSLTFNAKHIVKEMEEQRVRPVDLRSPESSLLGENDLAVLVYNGHISDQILTGMLMNDHSPVTITGLWKGSFDNRSPYHIMLLSTRLKTANRFYRNADGTTTVDSLNKTLIIDTMSSVRGRRINNIICQLFRIVFVICNLIQN